MKAVNLIPADQRTTARNVGKSGGGVYALLAVLGVAVLALAALTFTGRQASEREAQAASLEAQAQAAQAQAGAMASYQQFAALAASRTKSVRDLAATRQDWGRTLDQVSQVVPDGVSLSKLGVSTAPAAQGAGVALRSAMANPAIELMGCAPSQARVALLMARLRRIDGVVRVSVGTSDKATAKDTGPGDASTESGARGTSDCTGGSDQRPQFQIVAFLAPGKTALTGAATTATTATQAAIAVAKDPTSTTTTTPAPAAPGS